MARERRQPVRRILWQLILLIPKPVRRYLWERILDLPAPLRRTFWSTVVRKDRSQLDVSVADQKTMGWSTSEIRLRLPRPQKFDMLIFDEEGDAERSSGFTDIGRRLASQGHRVFYLGVASRNRDVTKVVTLGDGLYSIVSHDVPGRLDGTSPSDREHSDETVWTSLRYEYNVVEAVCAVGATESLNTARALRRRFGWKVVYDLRREPANTTFDGGPVSSLDSIDLTLASRDASSEQTSSPGAEVLTVVESTRLSGEEVTAIVSTFSGLYPLVSVIVLMYNGIEYNRQCLGSIFEKTAYPNLEIVVVDNNSTDGTRDFLRDVTAQHPNVKVRYNEKNEGYTRGNNQGAELTTGEYLVFLNNDTILTRSCFSRLVFYLNDPKVGLVGPTSSWPGNESGIETDYRNLTDFHGFSDRYAREHEGVTYEAGRMIFFCAATRRNVFQEVGPLDERYCKGVSFEDDDYTMRVRQRGYRVIYARDAFVHHWGVGTNSRRDMKEHWKLIEINRRQFEEKWGVTWDPRRGVLPRAP